LKKIARRRTQRIPRFWQSLWKRQRDFLDSGSKEFRHGASFVGVSKLAGQYYCEYKAENEFTLGRIETETKTSGTALHDELIPSTEITAREFIQLVRRKEPSYAVLGVWGSVGGLKMVGTPDHIVWAGGRPLWLVELKTTGGDPEPLWRDQENQVRIYGLLLDLMGFDCTALRLALARVRARNMDDKEKMTWVQRISESLLSDKVPELEKRYAGRMKVHLLGHERAKAEAAVIEKAGYWLGRREATSSTSAAKCRACEYRLDCPKTLYGSV
jgi:hypothetical protein